MSTEQIRKIINLLESIDQPLEEVVDKIETKHEDPNQSFDSGTAFGQNDRFLLQNAEHLSRIEKALSKTSHMFEIYFINHNQFDADHKKLKFGEPEEEQEDWFDLWQKAAGRIGRHKESLGTGIWNEEMLGVTPIPGKIIVLIMGNISTYHQPMTPWIVAHKVAHAWCDEENTFISESLSNLYKKFKFLVHTKSQELYPKRIKKTMFKPGKFRSYNLLSTKSGRLGQNHHHEDEALVEMVTQYLITGKVTFNIQDLPVNMHPPFLKLEYQVNQLLDQVFKEMEGSIVITA